MVDFILMYILGFAMFVVWTKYFWAPKPKNQETIIKSVTDPASVKLKDAIPLFLISVLLLLLIIILIVNLIVLIFKKVF